MKKAYMIMDLQFGSTGKGLLAGYLAKTEKPDTIATAWGPNAGHTYIDEEGRKFVHTMLANGIVSPKFERLLIGPGSVLNLQGLLREVTQCRDLLRGKTIVVHPMALVVNRGHRELEAEENYDIGSTMKGTGAVARERIRRDPGKDPTIGALSVAEKIALQNCLMDLGVNFHISAALYRANISRAEVMQIEGAQGFSLSIYHGFYPYTTSRDVTPAQVMADCAIPYSVRPEVYGTVRTLPIRVANRFNRQGDIAGYSGPPYSDQVELEWDKVGLKPEYTTVTQLRRRLFSFSEEQIFLACHQCSPTKIFLNFANYVTPARLTDIIQTIEQINGEGTVCWIGKGPTHGDVHIHPSNEEESQ